VTAAGDRQSGGAAPQVGVVVLGGLNTDLVVEVARLPRPGETVVGGDLQTLPGGKAANQAVAARRLGARVALVGAVGDDDLGGQVRAGLEAEGVDVRAVRTVPGRPSGVALIVVQAGGENTITVAPGSNGSLGPDDAAAAADALRTADALLLQLETPVAASLAAARAARAAGRLVVVNTAPLAAPVPDDVRALVAAADVVVANEEEAAALEGDVPDRLVVTLGARGARWSEGGATGTAPAFAVDAVDAVGAGDTFSAALTVALAGGATLEAAVRRGCAAGALATLRSGAQSAMPTSAAVDELLARASGARR
jgi:ribokinase